MMLPTSCVCVLSERGRWIVGLLGHCSIMKDLFFLSLLIFISLGLMNCFLFKSHYLDITNKKTNLLFYPWNVLLFGSSSSSFKSQLQLLLQEDVTDP